MNREIQGRLVAIKRQLTDALANIGALEAFMYMSAKAEKEDTIKPEILSNKNGKEDA